MRLCSSSTCARRPQAWAFALIAVFALALGVGGCATPPAFSGKGEQIETRPLQLEAYQIVVGIDLLTPELRGALALRLARYFDIEIAGVFPLQSIDLHCVVYRVPAHRDITELIAQLSRQPGVRLVQRNQKFVSLSGADQRDPYAAMQYGPKSVGAPAAHRWVSGKGIRLAVIDTGADFEHPDLEAGRLTIENFVEGGRADFAADRHGTAVVGIIAAQRENGEGIYGIAPGVDLLVSKACWHPDAESEQAVCSSWTIARAIDDALVRGVGVINLSLAGPPDELIERLIRRAEALSVVVVAAGGESSSTIRFPASLDTVIAVFASDPQGGVSAQPLEEVARAVAAPGIEILTTAPNARYLPRSGSSLAAAHVAGAVALLLEYQPTRSAADLASLVMGRFGKGAADGGWKLAHLDVCASLYHASGGLICAPGPGPGLGVEAAPLNSDREFK